MNLEKVRIQMPKTSEDVDSLFIQLKQLEDNKKQLSELQKTIKEQEDEINKVLENYALEQLDINPDFKHKSDIGVIQQRKQSTWKYEDEKSIIKQLKVIDPSLVRVKEEIDKVKLKKKAMIGADGEIILGDNFTVIDKVIVEDVKKLSISLKKEGEKDEEYEVID